MGDEAAAVEELVRRYMCASGPVTLDDVSWWTGFTKRRCSAALDSLGPLVSEVIVEDWLGPLYAAGRIGRAPDLGSGVVALPVLDPYVQGYRDRTRFLAPQWFGHVYDAGGNATATLVHRGRVVGVWQVSDDPCASIRFHLFEDSPRALAGRAATELAALGAFYYEDDAGDVIEMRGTEPLRSSGGRSAMHPLDSTVHRASRRGRSFAR